MAETIQLRVVSSGVFNSEGEKAVVHLEILMQCFMFDSFFFFKSNKLKCRNSLWWFILCFYLWQLTGGVVFVIWQTVSKFILKSFFQKSSMLCQTHTLFSSVYHSIFCCYKNRFLTSLAVSNRSNKKLHQLKKLDLLLTSDHVLLVRWLT